MTAYVTTGGPPGPAGPAGPAGATGATGSSGAPGAPGENWFTGSGAPAGATGVVGDWYIDTASGNYYEKTGASTWTLRGNLQGPAGATGSAGTPGTAGSPGEKWFSGAGAPSGATGIVGDWYLDTASGDVYEKTGASTWTLRANIKGPTGSTGSAGSPGAAGAKWLTGAGAPASGSGAVGDFYLDSANGDYYEKTGASTWTLRGNLKGPQGTAGTTGSTGPQGPTGQAEAWWSGSGAPAGATGVVGDWYLNTANGDVYEKTGASTWTLQGNIKGPTGSTGSAGSPGAPGAVWFTGSGAPAGATGVVGDFYLNSANGDFYQKTGASTWTLQGNLKGPSGSGSGDMLSTIFDVKGDILAATSDNAYTRLAAGANANYLRANSATATGLEYGTIPESDVVNLVTDLAAKVAKATLTTKGDIFAASGASTPARQAVGANGTFLKADSAQANGVNWAALTEADITNLVTDLAALIAKAIVTTKGDIIGATGASTPVRVGVGTDGQFLKAASGQAAGVQYANIAEADVTNLVTDLAAKISASIVDAKGDLIAATADNTPVRKAVGVNGTYLKADSTQADGLAWAPASGGGIDEFTVLCVHADGVNASTTFTDSAFALHTITAVGTAKVDTAQSKFGGSSFSCDGAGGTISTPDHPDFAFGAGDFTIDFWFRPNGITGFHSLAGKSTGASGGSWWFAMSADTLYIYMGSGTTAWDIANARSFGSGMVIGTWYHMALVRRGNTFSTYRDGVLGETWTSALALNPGSDPVVFGSQQAGASGGAPGWLDEIRISKGIARWTANFTPPSTAYTGPVLRPSLGASSAATITDWNNAVENGWYMGSAAANAPSALTAWAIGEVVVHRNDTSAYITQRVWDFTSFTGSQIYERRCINGTWQGWVLADIPHTIVDAKGDLLVASAADTVVRKAVGSNDSVLTAASAQADGLIWQKVGDSMVLAGSNLAKLSAVTGTPDGTKLFRDDGTWQKLADASVLAGSNLAKLAAVTGTPNGLKYLRDDGSWQLVTSGSTTSRSVALTTGAAVLPDGSAGNLAPALNRIQGTETNPKKHFLVLAYDGAGGLEHAWWSFRLPTEYASGGTLKLSWMVNSVTAANVKWQARVGAITPADADTPVEHAEAAAASVTTAVNTTEARRLIESSITLTMDSAAGGDIIFIDIFRDSADAADTCTVDAELISANFEYVSV